MPPNTALSGRAGQALPQGKRALQIDLKSRNLYRQTPVRRLCTRWAAK